VAFELQSELVPAAISWRSSTPFELQSAALSAEPASDAASRPEKTFRAVPVHREQSKVNRGIGLPLSDIAIIEATPASEPCGRPQPTAANGC
jgi:hypothetical protein